MLDGLFLIENRKQITSFNKKEVPADMISQILNCGRTTPTQKHAQEWKFVVVKEKSTLDKIATIINVEWFRDAPVSVLIFSKKNPFYIEYTSQAIAAMQLSASYYSIGSYLQLTHNEPYEEKLSSLMNAPKDYVLIGVICFGYYNFPSTLFSRVPALSEVVVTERFK